MTPTVTDWVRQAQNSRIKVDSRQTRLSRQWLPSVRAELLERAQAVRRSVDGEFAKTASSAGQKQMAAYGETAPHLYPIGYCHWITDCALPRLEADPLVQRLRQAGLAWRKVYFILQGRGFQNAIQCGDWLLDVAENALDLRDAPVDLSPLDSFEWENLDGWPRYAEIAEIYYGARLYPNLYFPLAFPLAPCLAIRSNGRIDLLYQQDNLFFLDLAENWRRARQLLTDSRWLDRQLPADYERLLEQQCGQNDIRVFPLEYRKSTPADLSRTIDEWRQAATLPPEQLKATVNAFRQVTQIASEKLRQADLRPGADRLKALQESGETPGGIGEGAGL